MIVGTGGRSSLSFFWRCLYLPLSTESRFLSPAPTPCGAGVGAGEGLGGGRGARALYNLSCYIVLMMTTIITTILASFNSNKQYILASILPSGISYHYRPTTIAPAFPHAHHLQCRHELGMALAATPLPPPPPPSLPPATPAAAKLVPR